MLLEFNHLTDEFTQGQILLNDVINCFRREDCMCKTLLIYYLRKCIVQRSDLIF